MLWHDNSLLERRSQYAKQGGYPLIPTYKEFNICMISEFKKINKIQYVDWFIDIPLRGYVKIGPQFSSLPALIVINSHALSERYLRSQSSNVDLSESRQAPYQEKPDE